MFEAVDIELLHELIDVVVFSGKGDRPNSNEMSGANLDGDQFKVIWDPEFILHHNEKSFDYHFPSATEIPESFNDPNSDNTVSDLMIKSFKTFIMEDSIGAISNAHLANSDIYGIFSETCSKIAVKHDKAVNFQETGIIPDGLTRQWSEDGMQPPEKVERYPNFMPKIVASSYKSVRFLGGLHERLLEFKEILKHEKCDSDEIIVDPSFVVSDDQVYYDDALKLYNEYSILIQNLCESYGIQNDGELFSGHFIALKNRLFERDEDKMSFFNTEYIIEEQMANIFEQIRIKFFEKSGELERNTEIDDKNGLGIPRQAFSPICFAPTSELCKKASAFYRVAYERKNIYQFDIFCRNMDEAMHLRVSNDFVSLPSAQICHHNNGLRKLLFFIRKWGAKQRLDEICPKSLDALVILFGSGRFDVTSEPYITIPYYRDDPVDDLENKNGGLGRIFLNFIQGLLTQKFISSDVFSLLPFSKRVLPKHQCLMLHYKAIETVYPIAFNRIFHTLPAEMFVIEMPLESENYEELLKKLGEKCGCKYVTFKIKSEPRSKFRSNFVGFHLFYFFVGKKTFRVALQAVGTFWATWKFREILLPPPNMNEPNFEQRNALLGDEAYKRLQFFISEENSIDDIYPF
uniref:RNA-dependent RNA polymerase n=1 Tax=Panagrolaimus superbus TaxID=310955 RepID=A0A914YX60_9BILA